MLPPEFTEQNNIAALESPEEPPLLAISQPFKLSLSTTVTGQGENLVLSPAA